MTIKVMRRCTGEPVELILVPPMTVVYGLRINTVIDAAGIEHFFCHENGDYLNAPEGDPEDTDTD